MSCSFWRIVVVVFVVSAPLVSAAAQTFPDPPLNPNVQTTTPETAALLPPPLDTSTAVEVRPYAIMACDAYAACRQDDLLKSGYVKDDLSWQDALRKTRRYKNAEQIINVYERAGFSATFYHNDQKKETVLAIRGTIGDPIAPAIRFYIDPRTHKELLEGGWYSNFRGRGVDVPNSQLEAQYIAGRVLATNLTKIFADTKYQSYSNSLTGHSQGGGIASYAGQFTDAKIVTIDPARNAYSTSVPNNPRQINIIASGDPVSDRTATAIGGLLKTGEWAGSTNPAPGRTFRVDGLPNGPVKDILNTAKHDRYALVDAISELAQPSRKLVPPGVSSTNPVGSTTGSFPAQSPAATVQQIEAPPKDQYRSPADTTRYARPADTFSGGNRASLEPRRQLQIPNQAGAGVRTVTTFSYPNPDRRPPSISQPISPSANPATPQSASTPPAMPIRNAQTAAQQIEALAEGQTLSSQPANPANRPPAADALTPAVTDPKNWSSLNPNTATPNSVRPNIDQQKTPSQANLSAQQNSLATGFSAPGSTAVPHPDKLPLAPTQQNTPTGLLTSSPVQPSPASPVPATGNTNPVAAGPSPIRSKNATAPLPQSQPTVVASNTPSESPIRSSRSVVPSPHTVASNGYSIAQPQVPSEAKFNTAPSRVGGISLSKAAAEHMSLNLDVEGSYFSNGQIVLAGQFRKVGMDAALFLTAIRLACERGDPSFSLDPDDGKAWIEEGRQAHDLAWKAVKKDFQFTSWRGVSDGLSIHAVSMRRDYPTLWATLEPKFPDLKSRLVFRPEWMRQTHVGEILYKADVLLKELSSGAPALGPGKVRALSVDRFLPSDARRAAKLVFAQVSGLKDDEDNNRPTGARLWFDLVPQDHGNDAVNANPSPASQRIPMPDVDNPGAAKLYSAMSGQGYFDVPSSQSLRLMPISLDSDVLDLSHVYPKMLIRNHDFATGQDLAGDSPDLDALAADVNVRTPVYARAYKELQDLTDVFRTYIAAVRIAQQDLKVCTAVGALPLLDSEKIDHQLPSHHPSELFMTVANFASHDSGQKRWWGASASSTNGGISMRGKVFYAQSAHQSAPTPVTREIHEEISQGLRTAEWTGRTGKQYIALRLAPDPDEPVPTKLAGPSGTVGRYAIFEARHLTGNKLSSTKLSVSYSKSPTDAQKECGNICSNDTNCSSFNIDQSTDACHLFSTVYSSNEQANWLHGEWR